MTRLEKAKEIRPDLTEDEIIHACPDDILDMEWPMDECLGRPDIEGICCSCWNEPYEEGETK